MGVDDDRSVDIANPELPHIAEEEQADGRPHPQGSGLAEDGLEYLTRTGRAACFHRALSPFADNTASAAKTARKTRPKTMKASAARKSTAKQ
ncbi:MAG: hypothetical protein H6P96_266 [Candidatus Aminicenantes bacterium]|nr:hypothetical protein [Candidatus Aminicenantes bacterium]